MSEKISLDSSELRLNMSMWCVFTDAECTLYYSHGAVRGINPNSFLLKVVAICISN